MSDTKQFNVSKLRQLATSQQQDEPFIGGQRMSGGTADYLNERIAMLDALHAHQGGVDAPEPPPPPPPPSRFATRPDAAQADLPATPAADVTVEVAPTLDIPPAV